ncbi:MAG: NADH-quinone oxidoreductase subunit C [Actinobacteria bacterium]|nr:NADH-quinone oxidoreductase subunit C [Actinomycetota bacterium]
MTYTIPQDFKTLPLDELIPLAQAKKDTDARFMNLHASTLDNAVDLTYSFTTDEEFTENYHVIVGEGITVPSISSIFLAAFFYENEVHDLFGVDFEGIAIDFGGNFYQVSIEAPMKTETTPDDQYATAKNYGVEKQAREERGEE